MLNLIKIDFYHIYNHPFNNKNKIIINLINFVKLINFVMYVNINSNISSYGRKYESLIGYMGNQKLGINHFLKFALNT